MSKFKLGKKVWIKELKEYGTIVKMSEGKVDQLVLDDGTIIEAYNLTLEIIGLFKKLWKLIKGIFR